MDDSRIYYSFYTNIASRGIAKKKTFEIQSVVYETKNSKNLLIS